jgi:hypothetical protein
MILERIICIFGVAATLTATAAANLEPWLNIRVCALPPISRWLASAAISEASRILQMAHIQYVWLLEASGSACVTDVADADLTVQILSRAPVTLPKGDLATAIWSGLQRTACVYSDRASEFLAHGALLYLAIGRAMAHEVTHLLLPREGSHATSGLMRPQWSRDDFVPGAAQRFTLTPSAKREMEAEALRRERLREQRVSRKQKQS